VDGKIINSKKPGIYYAEMGVDKFNNIYEG
jgi:hypothetical protein